LLLGCGRVGYEPVALDPPTWEAGDLRVEDARDSPYANANVRSIGVAGDLHNAGTASVAGASALVTFDNDLPASIGTGDEFELAGETLYVRSVESARTLTLQEPATIAHTGETYQLRRAFTTLQDWEDAREGDLVAEQRLEIGMAYNDGPFETPLSVRGSTTNKDYFMWLTVAPGHRHRGVAGSGVQLRIPTLSTGGANLVSVIDNYFRLHWFELSCDPDAGWIGNGIVFGWPSNNPDLAYLLVHDGDFTGVHFADRVSNAALRNSIIYGFGRSGVTIGGPHDGELALLVSNTIYGNTGGGISTGRDINDLYFIEAHGNIVVGNGAEDFGGGRIYGVGSDNISTDSSAPGSGALRGEEAEDYFVSTSKGSEDLHLRSTAPAIDRMTTRLLGSGLDIDQEARPSGSFWDVGADEYLP
jgi:hypothetical protein